MQRENYKKENYLFLDAAFKAKKLLFAQTLTIKLEIR